MSTVETVGAVVDFQKAELFIDKLFTDPELLAEEMSGQVLATLALGIILLYDGMREQDLSADEVVKHVETLLQQAALLTLPSSDVPN